MAYEVIWTLHAEEDYRQIIFYLKKEWSETVALNIINTTEARIERIAHAVVGRLTNNQTSNSFH